MAPSIVPGSFTLAASTDSNIIGDGVTKITQPAFNGTITVADPAIDPLAGQTVYLDVSTAGNGVYNLLNAGTAVTNANGTFTVKVGTDGADTGLVTAGLSLPNSPYIVGANGILNPIVGETGDSYFRIRVVDQSGNATDQPTDPQSEFEANNALTRDVIDTTPPIVTSFLPSTNTKLTPDSSNELTFTFTVDKNLDPSSLNAANIQVVRAGAGGVLGVNNIAVPIVPGSIKYTYLANGPQGPMQVTFKAGPGLPDDIYQVILKGTTASPIRDVAGNPLGGGVNFTSTYVVEGATPTYLFVANPGTYTTSTSATLGSRANPFPSITAALAAASTGNVIAVLPGVYTESITLVPYVSIVSADPTSTNTKYVIGDAQTTIIRAPGITTSATIQNNTITANNIPYIAGAVTEVGGLSIASPLNDNGNNAANGPIDPNANAIVISNSDVLIDRDNILDAGNGVSVFTNGVSAPTPDIQDDVIVGQYLRHRLQRQGAIDLRSRS